MNGDNTLLVGDTVTKVYGFLWDARTDLLRMAAVPVLLLSVLLVLMRSLLIGEPESAGQLPSIGLPHVLIWLASLVFYVMFAVACHRRYLKPDEQTTVWAAIRWDPRKSRYLMRWFLTSIIATVSAAPVIAIALIAGPTAAGVSAVSGGGGGISGLIFGFGILGAAIIVMLANGRLALWLPAAAIDEDLNLPAAWILGTGNSWRLFGIFLLSMAPGTFVLILVDSAMLLLGELFGFADSLSFLLIATLATNTARYVAIAATVIALSFCYKALRRPAGPGMPFYTD